MDEIVESENMDVITIVTPSNGKKVESNHESAGVKSNGDAVEPKTVRKNSFRPPVIEDWNSDDESEVEIIPKDKTVSSSTKKIKFVKSARETVEKVETSKQNKHYPRGNQRNWNNLMSQRLGSDFKMINKACFVCGSFEHLHYVCDKKVIRPMWNNSNRVNQKKFANKMTHPHPNRRFVPQAVLTKFGKISTASASINTAVRPVNTTGSKTTVNHPRSISNAYKKGYSQVTRPFNKYSEYKNSIFNKKVNTVRIKDTTARDKAVVSENKGKEVNAVKASACWGNPQQKEYKEKGVTDSGCLRHMTGNKCYLTEYEDYDGGFVSFGDGKGRISRKVLLRVPRKDNIYSVDLKSVVPTKGLTCLFSKATIDESNLWHRRLGHINFKNMNKLVRENVVRSLPSKIFENDHSCVASQKGKQHKASCKAKLVNSINKPLHMLQMDLFGPTHVKSLMKKSYCLVGIKREFSVARTPQQNGVAERRNRTLIEAARTMLVDSKLPTTFWAEVVNIACYVLNRVLVIKPHTKTPYELIHGRTPLIDFMKPFGCHVTILNTRDHLGKFDGKADEEFFVGYSLINEDPAKEDDKSGQGEATNTNSTSRLNIDANGNSIYKMFTPVNAAGSSCDNLGRSIPVNVATLLNDNLHTNPLMLDLEDIGIFSGAYDDEDVGAEANLNNLETTMNVSLILTTRIHKDHPKNQIIRDINSVTQTRKMTKISKEYAMMDVKSAFLYDTIEEEETLSTYLLENGFGRGTIDKTLFIKKDRGNILLVQVYVDDITFRSTKKSLCVDFEQIMHKRFQISFIGEVTFFLGLQVQQKADGIFISQDKYVADILKKFDFVTVKTTSTPMEPNKVLVKDEEAEDVDVHLYRSMNRSLMYLTASRPDITFAVCACARFQVTPKTSHLHAVKRIFRYLKGQPKLGLWYPIDSSFDLESFSDSDYARASLDKKSITGGCQFLGKRLISWQCKKQTIVANSTTEAEYVAAANCYGQVLWIQNQMLDYGFNFMNTKIYIDNESTICIVKNPVFHSKTKHIEIRHHFIRDSHEKKLIQVIKIHTDHNVADLLTKGRMIAMDWRCFLDEIKVNTGISKISTTSSMVGFGEMRQLEVS
ncbi:putative ribonuclease H-like domain-containing protein, partial [Tanacetum coccineum]